MLRNILVYQTVLFYADYITSKASVSVAFKMLRDS